MKSLITEYPKILHKLSKTVRQAEKVSSSSSLNIDAKKFKNFLNKKNVNITKGDYGFKGYASTYNINTLNAFNPDLHNFKIMNLQLKIN